ncbi:PAAR domain-containing protein [Granulicella tundricola]|uniref:PAAR repeat-containing protein n=1 Tax=Granulicella tundricola (strain ATCC BAA-1859 / DSM 23138 / MP5ACTX9) TaxID=1198114 RepID=E8WW36_GRATM|nr:PAAR domain-containing protein [Granulicella tundricola]ADW67342.1 PAAR repeat-containing protein [Granulicella tundricola MP5ACTX9]
MPPAARVTDMHTCPMVTGIVPHVGGPILPPAAPTVLIGFLPAARVTDMLVCVGPPDIIVKGSAGVFINFLPAARMGDMTAHGGVIILGEPTVMIGEIGSPSPGAGGIGGIVAGLAGAGLDPNSANQSKYAHNAKNHKLQSPCIGKGLAASANEKAFAKDMKQLQKDWKTLTPAQRQQHMKDMVNKQLAKSGVPTVGISPNPTMGPGTNGQMNFQNWRLDMNPALMNSPDLTNQQTEDLGNTLYHESRHAEQWYLIGRKEAGEGKTAAQIRQSTQMLGSTATAAAAHPLAKNDPMAACAGQMFNSVYGTGAAHRNTVLTALGPNRTAYNAALANYNAVNANPASTLAQKQAAYAAYQSAAATDTANYNQYRALPEEADAWHAGNSVGSLLHH